jgi:hypothetical protein
MRTTSITRSLIKGMAAIGARQVGDNSSAKDWPGAALY